VLRLSFLHALREPAEGYAFFEQMLWQIHRAGGLIREVPIIFTDRQRGASKADLRQMLTGGGDLLRFAAATWFSTGARS